MTLGLRELTSRDLAAELEGAIVPVLTAQLNARSAGHCMRVSDLDVDLMVGICAKLQSTCQGARAAILVNGKPSGVPTELAITSTKLVELRNPKSDGTQRPPLLVFIPSGLRAAAEDSFGVATFEELQLGNVYPQLRNELFRAVPTAVRGALVEGIGRLTSSAQPWPFADDASIVRYLLTGKNNGCDSEAYGAALYELGLVPDFELLNDAARAPSRIVRNRECVTKRTWSGRSDRGRVLELGLSNRGFRTLLGNFIAEAGVEDPRAWTRKIVLDRSNWPLAFNRWEFEDGGTEPDSVCVHDVTTDLPVLEDKNAGDRLDQLVGQQILPLGPEGLKKFSTTFQVDPLPSRVQGLAKFTAQVISKEHGPVGLVRAKKVWQSNSSQANIAFSKLSKIEWEEGWHFVRLIPQTEDGDLIPIVDQEGNPLPWSADDSAAVRRPNESDLFYVLPANDVEVEPAQRAIPNDPSVAHALLRLQFTALGDERDPAAVRVQSVEWAQRRAGGRPVGLDQIEARFPRDGAIHVPVSRQLKLIEQKILGDAAGPLSWRLPISLGQAGTSTGEVVGWPSGPEAAEFLAARQKYFQSIQAGESRLVTQGADLHAVRELIIDYARKYLQLIQNVSRRAQSADTAEVQRCLAELRRILSVDTVNLVITDHREHRREAALVGPTHPLRALWLATWAELGAAWLKRCVAAPKEFVAPTREAILRQLAPVAFPPVLPTDAGSVLTAVDSLNAFWTLYAPPTEEDPRGLLSEVCTSFGLPEPPLGGTIIDGAYLASRLRRYLLQHPYVRTLIINAFNAGRGTVLAEMLLALQRIPEFSALRYDIRLFVPDPEAVGVGEALAALLSAAGSISAKEADAFATPSASHLYPKLRLAIRPAQEFRSQPDAHAAHLSMLFDIFPAGNVAVARPDSQEACSPIYGLVQDFHVEYREDDTTVAWHRQPRHGPAVPLDDAEEFSDLLASLSAELSSAAATVATGQTGLGLRPVITLALDAEQRALLHQIHEVSDWVLTVDRNMGIEFFDHGSKVGRPDYLIDHSPEGFGIGGHRLVITSRSVAELEAMLRPVLQSYNLDAEGRHAVAILEQLRSLSGRLALKLISSSSQRAEALGLALSRMYLEHQGVFENQIVLPLDAHIDLYRVMKGFADDAADEVSFRRTDLALFDLNSAQRLVTCRLVEVKCYNQVGDVAAYNQLKSSIAEQIQQSEEVLAHHFDPNRTPVDRPDRLMKTRQLVTLLEFYLDRAKRYGVISPECADEARFFLRTMELGYRLVFTRSALIFDFSRTGTEAPDYENGIEFHRVGIDLIKQLVNAAAPDGTSESGSSLGDRPVTPPDGGKPSGHGAERVQLRRERAASVPTLVSAAFLGTKRDRSVSWEKLNARRALGDDEPLPRPEAVQPQAAVVEDAEAAVVEPTSVVSPALQPSLIEDAEIVPSGGGKRETDSPSPAAVEEPHYDVMLGVTSATPQYGILGELAGRKVGLDLNQTHTISLFGVQGGGKSYTLGMIAEMASLRIPHVNQLPSPLATVIFHYSPTMDYRPEFTSMVRPNADLKQLATLRETYGAAPQALTDVVLLVPEDKLAERRAEYPGIAVHPLKFATSELKASHWRFLMGAVGNQATYIRQLNRVIKTLRNELTLDGLRQGIDAAGLPDHLKDLARMRLDLAAEYVNDDTQLSNLIRPGRLLIVDLRDEFIEKDEALGLFVVMLQLFAEAKHNGEGFNKLVVFDEAHKYIESPDLVAGLVEVVREMRHKGTTVMVASQDPPSVPISLIELSSQIILHKFNSPAWLKHIQKANSALGALTPEKLSHLKPGEAFIWSSKATDEAFSTGAIKVKLRPRVTEHGGTTKTAVE
jgi:hypothetical protein